jgi:hypothetical protein
MERRTNTEGVAHSSPALQRWVPEKMTEVPQGTRRYAFEFSGIGMARFAGSWFDRDCKHLEFYQNHRLILLI